MNHFEMDVRESLDRAIGVPRGRPLSSETRARIRRRRARSVAGVVLAGVVGLSAVVGTFFVLPRSSRGETPAGVPTSWPSVVQGDPGVEFATFPAQRFPIVGTKHVLSIGLVDGHPFRLLGLEGLGSTPCTEIAFADTGEVTGTCVESPSLQHRSGISAAFPGEAEILMTTGTGGSGVCTSCVGPQPPTVVMGFTTARIVSLRAILDDGTQINVPVLHWPNRTGAGAFLLFPPTPYLSGYLGGFDADGTLLAKAPFCGPEDPVTACGPSAVEQIAPIP